MYWSLRMRVLLVLIIVITVLGTSSLGAMFADDDSRLGLAGLTVLIAAEVMAMVYAVMDE
jgi:hypothetical protein